jgi:hypothetical protein
MQDEPTGLAILDNTIRHIRENVIPTLEGRPLFEMRVTASALDLVRREFALKPSSDAAEGARLKALLKQDGDLFALNQALCAAIRDGAMDETTPGLIEHLRATALEKLAVDQPTYSAYRRAMEEK